MAPSFAPGCCDPRAAYAMGMVVKMLKTQAQASPSSLSPTPQALSSTKLAANSDKSQELRTTASGGENEASSPVIWQVKLEKLQRVLESPQVQAQDKQGLVDMIEDAVNVQDVWAYLDGVGCDSNGSGCVPGNTSSSIQALEKRASELSLNDAQQVVTAMEIPMELGCAICCSDLMLKPVSLACGHSFCKYCLELWLANRSNCPSCRHPIANSASDNSNSQKQQQLSVNLALQHVIATFYPAQLQELEKQSQTERFEQLRCAIREALCSSDGEDLREVLAHLPRNNTGASNLSSNHQDQSLAVSLILESDVELQERVLAAEIHERLRKERLLRESSRRRHMAAYNATGLSTQVDPAILNMSNNSTTTVRRGASSHSLLGKSSSSSHGSSGNSLMTAFLGRKS